LLLLVEVWECACVRVGRVCVALTKEDGWGRKAGEYYVVCVWMELG
jgi:hypothetical protein